MSSIRIMTMSEEAVAYLDAYAIVSSPITSARRIQRLCQSHRALRRRLAQLADSLLDGWSDHGRCRLCGLRPVGVQAGSVDYYTYLCNNCKLILTEESKPAWRTRALRRKEKSWRRDSHSK